MGTGIWRALSISFGLLMAVCLIVAVMSIDICPLIECTSGMVPMRCHWAFIAVSWVSGIGIADAIFCAIAQTKEARRYLALAALIVAVVAFMLLTPAGIGVCAHDDSACHLPAIAIQVMCMLCAIIAMVQIWRGNPEEINKPKRTL